MKLLLVRSHPRAAGYTRYCTDFFKQGALEAGADVIDVDLCSMHLEHCLCCYGCWTASPGICVIADDMGKLLTAYLDADILVLATPLNAYGVNSR
ncbi:MAG TPA: NAD(P)H-dependent oxidoreductase, partial [Chitinivibrionales bacterium]